MKVLRAVDWPAACLVIVVGALGGLAATLIGTPLPILLGSLLAVGGLALSGWQPFGITPSYPMRSRDFFIPIIGLSIGGAFTPGLLEQALSWWPSLLALVFYIPLVHLLTFAVARWVAGIDRITAFYATTPGGLIEAMTFGDEAGADPALLALLQFLRLALTIVLIPIGFSILGGAAVGSAAGMVIGGDVPLTPFEWVAMALAGAVGFLGGRRIGLPAAVITGPIILSGVLHATGIVEGSVPGWLIGVVQLVIGMTLGIRFVGRAPSIVLTAIRTALLTIPTMLAATGAAAFLLAPLSGVTWEAVYLAYAPGGLPEMTLVALSLETSVVFVAFHHVARIMLAVVWMQVLAGPVLQQRE